MPSLLVIGAHPDDAEYKAGGLAALYRQKGFPVCFVSVTNGESGHHRISGPPLVEIRRREATEATSRLGIDAEVWDYPDGRLQPSLDARERIISLIRTRKPDLVLTHRPNDYHPDHRVVGQLVQDAASLLTVPPICPEVPHLRRDPVIAYLGDHFTKPYPFSPTVAVDVAPVWDRKIDLLDAHRSQFYEWLPYNMRREDEIPDTPEGRRAWLAALIEQHTLALAEPHRPWLRSTYGDAAESLRLVELFEGSEYGSPLDAEAAARLFPFPPGTQGA